ncbi:hypothetical protein [Rosistilla oblonga]|uniref:hypothetical protein n=1 Tax=Rosistilla oblonga TaxID=2527990 RepID=UPI003A96E57C
MFADWSIPIPPDDANGDGDGGLTLRDLIERIVVQQVSLFRKRQHDRQFLRALTAAEISDAVDRGKVDLGGSEVPIQNVDEEQAIHNTIQAFEDGIYLVVIDEQEQKDLDKQIFLNAESRITFIRLTMLSGG